MRSLIFSLSVAAMLAVGCGQFPGGPVNGDVPLTPASAGSCSDCGTDCGECATAAPSCCGTDGECCSGKDAADDHAEGEAGAGEVADAEAADGPASSDAA